MLEVNANASFSRDHKLTAGGPSALLIDGPAGYQLDVTVHSGAPCQYARVDGTGEPVGRQAKLNPGQSFTATSRVKVWTTGATSHVHIVKPTVAAAA